MLRWMFKAGLGVTMCLGLGTSAPALAGPGVHVSVSVPPVVIGPTVVVTRPARPAPDWVWVEGGYRTDASGHLVWVPGHWRAPAPVVVHRSAPVVVRHPHPRRRAVVHRH